MVVPVPCPIDSERQCFLEGAFNAVQDGIALLDCDHRFVWANRWMETRFASHMPLVGQRLREVVRMNSDLSLDCETAPAQGAEPCNTQIVAFPSSGDGTVWLRLSLSRVEDRDGRLTGGLLHVQDFTERVRAEEMLREEVSRLAFSSSNLEMASSFSMTPARWSNPTGSLPACSAIPRRK